jgi:hypothetical protein
MLTIQILEVNYQMIELCLRGVIFEIKLLLS